MLWHLKDIKKLLSKPFYGVDSFYCTTVFLIFKSNNRLPFSVVVVISLVVVGSSDVSVVGGDSVLKECIFISQKVIYDQYL